MLKVFKYSALLFFAIELFYITNAQDVEGNSSTSNTNSSLGIFENHSTTSRVDDVTMDALTTETTDNIQPGKNERGKPALVITLYSWVLKVIVGSIIAMVGLIGNCVSVTVLTSSKMTSSSSVILICLAFFDSLILIRYILFISVKNIMEDYWTLQEIKNIYSVPVNVIIRPVEHIGHVGAMYTTALLTAERFIVVVFPLHAVSWCTVKRARICCLAIFLFSVIFNMPRMFVSRLEIVQTDSLTNGWKFVEVKQTHSPQATVFYDIYSDYLRNIFLVFLPPVLLIPPNICVIVKLYKSRRCFENNSNSNSSGKTGGNSRMSDRVTAMTMAIVFSFCVSLTFFQIDRELCHVDKEQVPNKPDMCRYFSLASELIYVSNSSINFYFYCLFGRRFREALVSRFSCCKRKTVTNQTQSSNVFTTSL